MICFLIVNFTREFGLHLNANNSSVIKVNATAILDGDPIRNHIYLYLAKMSGFGLQYDQVARNFFSVRTPLSSYQKHFHF